MYKMDTSQLLYYYKKLDIFSFLMGYERNESKRKKNYFGASLTVLIFIATSILSFLYGKEIYERKIPQVSLTDTYLKDSSFSLKNFTVFFMLSDTLGRISAEPLRYIKPSALGLSRQNSIVTYAGYKNYTFHRCTRNDLINFENKFGYDNIKQYTEDLFTICVDYDDDAITLNPYGFANSSYINFAFGLCQENCAEDLDDKKEDLYVRMFFVNTYADSLDHETPVKYFLDTINQQISIDVLKRIYVRIVNKLFISDEGWFLESIMRQEYLGLLNTNLEINSKTKIFPDDLYWITFECPQIRHYRYRNYMKIQDLLAKMGGMISGFMIIINVLFYHYFRFNYLVSTRLDYLEEERYNMKMSMEANICKFFNNNTPKENNSHKQPKRIKCKSHNNLKKMLNLQLKESNINKNQSFMTENHSLEKLEKGNSNNNFFSFKKGKSKSPQKKNLNEEINLINNSCHGRKRENLNGKQNSSEKSNAKASLDEKINETELAVLKLFPSPNIIENNYNLESLNLEGLVSQNIYEKDRSKIRNDFGDNISNIEGHNHHFLNSSFKKQQEDKEDKVFSITDVRKMDNINDETIPNNEELETDNPYPPEFFKITLKEKIEMKKESKKNNKKKSQKESKKEEVIKGIGNNSIIVDFISSESSNEYNSKFLSSRENLKSNHRGNNELKQLNSPSKLKKHDKHSKSMNHLAMKALEALTSKKIKGDNQTNPKTDAEGNAITTTANTNSSSPLKKKIKIVDFKEKNDAITNLISLEANTKTTNFYKTEKEILNKLTYYAFLKSFICFETKKKVLYRKHLSHIRETLDFFKLYNTTNYFYYNDENDAKVVDDYLQNSSIIKIFNEASTDSETKIKVISDEVIEKIKDNKEKEIEEKDIKEKK